MFKIFFVEDEAVLRNGIKNNIKWEETNFILTGVAADGEEALPLVRNANPDILVTDIKMPFMDGLELSKIVKNEMPHIKIIVLTGYDEFDFAREALTIGVSEYLLKPFAAAKLLEVLDKVAEEIKQEKLSKIRDYEKYVLEKNAYLNFEQSDEYHVANELNKLGYDTIIDFLRIGARDQIDEFLDEFIRKFEKKTKISYLYTYYLFMNVIVIASKFVTELGGDIDNIIPETKELETLCLNLDSMDKFRKYVKKIFNAVLIYRDDKKLNKYGNVILLAKEYIGKNYTNSEISLYDVANFVNMSPNHFSVIFKQHTGEAFIDYLTDFRIKKAMEILQTTSARSSEIATAVGYADAHYFSHLFKKLVKCTPTEFRNKSSMDILIEG
jgi:two-component system, response regulator YesN